MIWKDFDLQEWKEKNRITFRELKEVFEVSNNTIWRWMKQKRVPLWVYKKIQEIEKERKKESKKEKSLMGI